MTHYSRNGKLVSREEAERIDGVAKDDSEEITIPELLTAPESEVPSAPDTEVPIPNPAGMPAELANSSREYIEQTERRASYLISRAELEAKALLEKAEQQAKQIVAEAEEQAKAILTTAVLTDVEASATSETTPEVTPEGEAAPLL